MARLAHITLLFNDSYYLRSDENKFIMSPPLRRKELREELVRKLHMVNTSRSDYSGFMSVIRIRH